MEEQDRYKRQYTFEGKTYDVYGDDIRETDQIIDDFKYCESINDWGTIKNRILAGVTWGWMIEI